MPFIVPHFNYCAQTWHFCNKSSAETLEKVNERAVRFVLETDNLHMKNFLSILRRTLMEQRLSKILCSVFKLVNNKTNPESLNELISLRETTYALRGKDILKESKVNIGLNSQRYQAPKVWNNLPMSYNVIASSYFKTFKKTVRKWVINLASTNRLFNQFCK